MPRRVVLVTGSTSGIGLATARAFQGAGDVVVYNSTRSVDEGKRLAGENEGSSYVQGNIAQNDDCQRMVAHALREHGRLDVLVNNAGITKRIAHQNIDEATIDVWREIFDVNLFGTWQMCVAAMPALKVNGGAIVNVSSIRRHSPHGFVNPVRRVQSRAQSRDHPPRQSRRPRGSRQRRRAGLRGNNVDQRLGRGAKLRQRGRPTEAQWYTGGRGRRHHVAREYALRDGPGTAGRRGGLSATT